MKELIVYVLQGCSICKWLVKELDYYGIRYRLIDADKYGRAMDDLEDKLGTVQYPIVEVVGERGAKVYIVYRDSRRESSVGGLLEYDSVPDLVHLIRKIYEAQGIGY